MKKKTTMSTLLILAILLGLIFPKSQSVKAVGINKIINPSFEEGIDGWETINSTLLSNANEAHTGTKSLYVNGTKNLTIMARHYIKYIIKENDVEYYFGAWVKPEEQTTIFLSVLDNLKLICNCSVEAPKDVWTLIECTGTFKVGMKNSRIEISANKKANFYIDDVMMSKKVPPSSSPIPKLKNLIANESFEDGIYPGTPLGVDYLSLTSNAAHLGSKALLYDPTGVGGGQYGALAYDLTPIVETNGIGPFIFSAYLKEVNFSPCVCFALDVDGEFKFLKKITPGASWEQYTVKIDITIAEEGAESVKLLIYEEEYNHQFLIDDISLTKEGVYNPASVALKVIDGGEYKVEIRDWDPKHTYQIWSYQKLNVGVFGTGEEDPCHWILSHGYTRALDRRISQGFEELNGVLYRNIGRFNSIDDKYTIALKVIDENGEYVTQVKSTFTKVQVGEVKIKNVMVDSKEIDERERIRQIKAGGSVGIIVTANDSSGIKYSAIVDQTGQSLRAIEENKFLWNISGLNPGKYSITVKAFNAGSKDEKKVNFRLYKKNDGGKYAQLESLRVTKEKGEEGQYKLNIKADISNGDLIKYNLSEPWRAPFKEGSKKQIKNMGNQEKELDIPKEQYGIYQVTAYTYQNGMKSPDDGGIKTINYSRGGVSLETRVDEKETENSIIKKERGSSITIGAKGIGMPEIIENKAQYSYWRRDARGWILIRDYETEGSIVWKANRIGLYTIQVRAKLKDGLSYEVMKNIEFEITDPQQLLVEDIQININEKELNERALSRTPIMIEASYTIEDKKLEEEIQSDLLFKYIISNSFIHYIETHYSPDPTYIWTPGKPGEYSINVLVKNSASFGKYDKIKTFKVRVN